MKKFIIEIEDDTIDVLGLSITLEDYFHGLYMDGEIEEEPNFKIEEVEEN